MNSENEKDTLRPSSVAVVGGGLVGTLSAIYFAKRGWSVSLFELRKDVRIPENKNNVINKSINLALSTRGLSALAEVGSDFVKKVLDSGLPMKGRMIHVDGNGNNTKLVSNIYDVVYKRCIYSVERTALLELLLDTAQTFDNVKIYFEHQLKSCDFDNGSLQFKIRQEMNFKYNADLIIGADGAHSIVRSQLMRVVRYGLEEEYAIDPNYLHIWPRHSFMMIALPNKNKTFTCTLFAPNEKFESIKTNDDLILFFKQYFPDSIPLIGKEQLQREFFGNPKEFLFSIKCNPYHYKNRVVILGDAAHSMVPFFGQGMNCGFQDVEVLDKIFEQYKISPFRNNNNVDDDNKIAKALEIYTTLRHPDAIAICDLAMYNYIEMRSNVINPWFLIRRKLENYMHRLFPQRFLPLYQMVTFSTMRPRASTPITLYNRTLESFQTSCHQIEIMKDDCGSVIESVELMAKVFKYENERHLIILMNLLIPLPANYQEADIGSVVIIVLFVGEIENEIGEWN
ncbi:7308_t:CDS:2 [Entrophospora sp. SA101]|nr:7308_t:CDS:2 [Entrophospora sp. SA101]